MRRRAFTLVEVMVALGLMSVVLFFLLNFYRQMALVNGNTQKAHEQVFSRAFVQERVNQLISGVQAEDKEFFYTKADSRGLPVLHMRFDHGLDPDHAFCGPLLAELYLRDNGSLSVKISSQEGKIREEELMQGVKKIELSFFDPESGSWRPEWPQKAENLPPMVKLGVENEKKEKVEWAFFTVGSGAFPKYGKAL